MKRIFLFILVALAFNIEFANRLEKARAEMVVPSRLDLVRIELTNPWQLKDLDCLGVIINQVRENYCIAEVSPNLIDKLTRTGYKIKPIQENVSGMYYDNFFTEVTRGRYLTYTEFIDTMHVIATNHPLICKLETLGFSHQNRLLLALKISDSAYIDENEPEVYFDGNIHGDEKIGWAVCFEFIKYIIINYYENPQVANLVNNREIWVVPMINPDGFVNNVRYNGRSVDVNRNFGWMWGNETSCGADAFSENEATAFYNLFVKHPFAVYTTYHAGDSIISYPWSYTSYDTAPEKYLHNHLAVGYSSQANHYPYGQGSIVMYLINGSSKDYCYGTGGEISWSIEVHNTKTPPATAIDPTFNINRDAMLYLVSKAGQGIHGKVTDSFTGQPLFAQIWVLPRNWLSYSSPTNGDFHRFYLPGTYTLLLKSPGYVPETVSVVVPSSRDSSVSVEVKLIPDTIPKEFGMQLVHCRYVTTSSNRTYPVRALGRRDNIAYQLDNSKWIVIDMYKPIQNDSGYDFTVFRSSGTGTATVKISNNWKGPWTTIGTANSAINSFNISSSGFDSVRYVRLDATGTFGLDAIEGYVLQSSIEAPEPKLPLTKNNGFKIYPNLVSSQLTIEYSSTPLKDINFEIYDILGRIVKTFNLKTGENRSSFKLKDLKDGIYFIKAEQMINRFTVIR